MSLTSSNGSRVVHCVGCFGGTEIYVCVGYQIYVNMYHVSAQGVDEHTISVHY